MLHPALDGQYGQSHRVEIFVEAFWLWETEGFCSFDGRGEDEIGVVEFAVWIRILKLMQTKDLTVIYIVLEALRRPVSY